MGRTNFCSRPWMCSMDKAGICTLLNMRGDVLGGLGPPLTLKASSRGEAFPHTYKLTTNPFHNRCGTTPTISPHASSPGSKQRQPVSPVDCWAKTCW